MRFPIVFNVLLVLMLGASFAVADVIEFQLQGTGGFGLLGGNENPGVAGGGAGGVGVTGILFDTDTELLSLDLAWGSGNGFTDLTGGATAIHIHGPTASSGTDSFSQNSGVLINLGSLGGFTTDSANGGYLNTVSLAGNVAALLDGSLYVNVHTPTNGGGEIRGNLVAVPEPTSLVAIGGLTFGLIVRRRKRG